MSGQMDGYLVGSQRRWMGMNRARCMDEWIVQWISRSIWMNRQTKEWMN